MLETILRDAIGAMWIAWLAYWMLAARRTKATRWRERRVTQALDILLLWSAGALLLARRWLPPFFATPLLAPSPAPLVLGAAATALGLGFAVWARLHLGRNWSGTVTLKDEHTLIRSGPYAWVRYPIYSGILLALLGAVLAFGEWRIVAALALILIAMLRRVHVEEQHLSELFPDYDEYRRATAALIPLLY